MISLWASVALAATVDVEVKARGSGDPIGDADVTIGEQHVVTDASGDAHLDLPPGEQSIHIEHPQWLPADVIATVPVDGPVRVWLTPADPPMEVVVEAFKPTANIDRHVIDAEIAFKTPGTLDDSVRLVQSLPSVTIQREYSPSAGDLSIRGSSPGDNRYFFDGVELPYLYHYNQYASVVPTTQLDRLELFPSAQSSAYGDAIGGIVEATSRVDAPKTVHGALTVNLLMAGATARASLSKGWWLSASGRRSYYDLIGAGSAQYTLWPTFHDYALRVQHDLADGHLAIFAMGAGDRYDRAAGELDLLDPVEDSETARFQYRRGYDVLGVERTWNGAFNGRWTGGIVYDRNRGTLSTGGRESLQTAYATSRLDVGGGLSPHVGWGGGAEVRAEIADLVVANPGPEGLLVAEEAPALARGLAIDASLPRVRAAAYAEARPHWGGFRVFPGVRVAVDTGATAVVVDPRLAARWKLAKQTEIKAGGGWYHQSPDSELLFDHRGAAPIAASAWEGSVGIEQTVAQRLEFEVGAWGKQLSNMTVSPVDGPPLVVPHGHGLGAELVTRYRLRDHFFVWGWLGVAHSRVEIDGVQVPVDGDQPFTSGLVASWDPNLKWDVGVRYRYGAGLPYTAADGSIYDATHDAWIVVPGPQNGARLPPFQKVDAHLARSFPYRRWTLTTALELGVVPPSAAALYPTWNYDDTEQGWVKGPMFLPLLSARAEF